MKSLKISILVFASMVAACFMGTGKVQAQEFTIQGDLVSSYVWRGFYQTGASFQPTLGFGVGDFSLTAWGSTDFDGVSSGEGAAAKEIDLTAAYALGESGLTFSVASLWWGGQGARKYFNFKSHETAHHFEAGLAYTLPVESFLCQSLGTQCLPELTKMTKAGRIILRMLNSTIRSVLSL